MNSDWAAFLALGLWLITPTAIWFGRKWLVARLEKGIQHGFDKKLENLRGELRKSEEHLKSDLRNKEGEIAVLRNSILNGSANRQALLDKRRVEAVEKMWTAVNDLAMMKGLSASMAVLKFDAVAKEADDPKVQQFLEYIGASAPDDKAIKNVARDERPFLPEIAWAYFSAYTTILYGSLVRYKVLKIGLVDAAKYLTTEPAKKILRAALPHQSAWIEENEAGVYHYLLDEIEQNLLAELRKILDGKEVDHAAVQHAKEIMKAVGDADKENLEQAAEAAGVAQSHTTGT